MKPTPKSPFLSRTRNGSTIRCAIYTRVSTDDQARGDYNSLESQRDICKHSIVVQQHAGWAPILYYDDPGFSRKNLQRPGMQMLLRDVAAGEVDVVVAYKLDRITRSLPDFYEFWRVLEEHGVNFVSATQSFDTSAPMGKLMLKLRLRREMKEVATSSRCVRTLKAKRAQRAEGS